MMTVDNFLHALRRFETPGIRRSQVLLAGIAYLSFCSPSTAQLELERGVESLSLMLDQPGGGSGTSGVDYEAGGLYWQLLRGTDIGAPLDVVGPDAPHISYTGSSSQGNGMEAAEFSVDPVFDSEFFSRRVSLADWAVSGQVRLSDDFSSIPGGENPDGSRELDAARFAFSVDELLINPWAVSVRKELLTISNPPGLSYSDKGTGTTRTDIYAEVSYPFDWALGDVRPVCVYAYGSGWRGYQGTQVPQGAQGWAEYLVRHGMVVVSTHYRPDRATMELCMADAASAVRWTRENASSLGIAPDRITGGGRSSGGHIMLSTSVITGNPDNPWDDLSFSKECQYNFGHVAVASRPDDIPLSPAHNLRDGLPPYLQVVGTDDTSWKEFGYDYRDRLIAGGYDQPLWFVEGNGEAHTNWSKQEYNLYYQTQEFLRSFGAIDTVAYAFEGATVSVADQLRNFFNQGLQPEVALAVDQGGTLDGFDFVDDGNAGMSVVTATSVDDPSIERHAYISIGKRIWAEDATSVTRTGSWSQTSEQGKQIYHTQDPNATITYSVDLPAGDWVVMGIRWSVNSLWNVNSQPAITITTPEGVVNSTVNMHRQRFRYLSAGTFSLQNPGTVTITKQMGPLEFNNSKVVPLASWGLAILPRYTGGESGLEYMRGQIKEIALPAPTSAPGL